MASVGLKGITKQFAETPVIKGLDLVIADGEFLTLVGPSGCGKSTLLRIIAGLDEQTSGHVIIGDQVVDKARPSERDLAMVFQSYALYPHLSVFDNIAVPLRMRLQNRWHRLPLARWLVPGTRQCKADIKARVLETAEILGLEELLERKPGQLSGGQRQRVAVGRAIVRDPAAFLFDEPLSNLDAKLRVHMRTEIIQLHRQLKATFIYVTHDQAEAMTMSDRIAVMMDGELVQVGTPDDVYFDPQDVRVAEFIGSPKINLLPGEITDSGVVKVLGKTTAIDLELREAGPLRIGVRPENLYLCNADQASFEGRVELVENLGAEVFVHMTVNNPIEPVVLRLLHNPTKRIKPGDQLSVGFASECGLFFDQQGKRIDLALQTAEVVNG